MNTELITNPAEEITRLHKLASQQADTSKAHADSAIESAWLCGVQLNAQKEALPHGAWIPWVEERCPEIKIRTAQNYMGLATKYATLAHLKDAQRVKALIAAGVLDEPAIGKAGEHGAPKVDDGATWVAKAAVYFNTHDLTKLDAGSRQVWKERLRPLVEVYERL